MHLGCLRLRCEALTMALFPGFHIWDYNPAVPLVISTLNSPWFDTQGYTTLLPAFKFTNSTGTSVHSIIGSWDGITADTDLTALWALTSLTSGVAQVVCSPFFQWQTVQATANATVSKVFLQARI